MKLNKIKKEIYYASVAVGLFVVLYVQFSKLKNEYVLVLGILLFMFGLYNISSGLISKKEDTNFVKTEYEEEE